MMLNDNDLDKDEQQNNGSMIGKKGKCQCTNGCSTRSCSCFIDGRGCDSTCQCNSSCENIFNHLDYFFGENHKCAANACFSKWLIQKVKNADGIQKVNRDRLRICIKKSPK